jgi:hypothetical protein
MSIKPLLTSYLFLISLAGFAQQGKTALMIVGSDHFAQTYKKEFPSTDVLMPKAQKEVSGFAHAIASYEPDLVCVEVLPIHQAEIDSLYTLYAENKIDLKELDEARSEVYQIAFRVAKERKLKKIYCVNAPGGTSQSILDNGNNIEMYKKESLEMRAFAVAKLAQLQKGVIGFNEYLQFMNQAETVQKIYHLRYITPLRVTDGKFKNPDAMIDTAFINPSYIGAELTSTFKNRDYKIYSNILRSQLETNAKRVLLIIGVAHIGSLKSIGHDDDTLTLIRTEPYITK